MNGKQLFCLSLIILSVAMGMHWFKNKPKKKKKVSDRPRVALNLDDLQLQDEEPNKKQDKKEPSGSTDTDNNQDSPDETSPENHGSPDSNENGNETAASGTSEIPDTASTTEELNPELNDPIIIALKSMPRNPFETSPYAKLVEELRAAEDAPEEEVIKKTTNLINANFSATIKTKNELVAIIDSRLYRKGDLFQGKEITDIKPELVFLDTASQLFLIPKVGVKVDIATDGTYTFEDTFRKNN
ncbi:MAG: hypothetical protein Kow0029_16630 [Candidatus Rifleibacteriota bacterium]